MAQKNQFHFIHTHALRRVIHTQMNKKLHYKASYNVFTADRGRRPKRIQKKIFNDRLDYVAYQNKSLSKYNTIRQISRKDAV